ncbi:tRNA lysidine(34) synthetase TilS [Vagococcus sp.]|uniref:tRNA lysidine(34) synthetase TilS n=1 Tax=Vagococcus sp. TaxID=1933889 RepID=UPI003F97FCEB
MSLFQRFVNHVATNKWWQPEDKVLLAVSSGVDSMVLLELMNRLPSPLKPKIGVVHINHQLRPSSNIEADFLQNYCLERDLPYYCRTWMEGLSIQSHIEKKARDFRYASFASVAEEAEYTHLLTAHHQDDQVETILMRLISGHRLKSLEGIVSKRQLGEVALLRPLLPYRKTELSVFAKEERIPYFEDESNQELTYFRNRIRHELIPRLKEENQQVEHHLVRFAEKISLGNELIEQMITPLYETIFQYEAKTWCINQVLFEQATLAEQTFMLDKWCVHFIEETGLSMSQNLQAVLFKQLTEPHAYLLVPLKKDWVSERSYEKIKISQKKQKQLTLLSRFNVKLNTGIQLSKHEWFGFFEEGCEEIPNNHLNWQKYELMITLPDTPEIILRKRQAGDRIIYNHQGQSKRISRYFIDEKVPHKARDESWVVSTPDDELIWLVPFRESYLSIQNETAKIQYKLIYCKQWDK